ncbi:MAG: DUF4124 domain-containing protein [Rhodanobacteraceae bacterium]|nr:MAG: DUF4124 domain-containing protein [Rhodanobacteraceae bacterium]
MRRTVFSLLPVALLAVVLAVPAAAGNPTPTEHYRWKDTAGVVHFSDTIPASALAGGYEVVDDKGRVVRTVARELTPAERRVAEAEAARAAAAKRAAQQQSMEDAQMLAAYPTDTALVQSQQAQLKQIEASLATLQANLASQEDSLTELLSHAADLEHAKKPLPPYVGKQIASQRDTVNNERAALAQRRADLARTKARFAAQLQRYRSLRAKYQGDAASQ